MPTTIFEPKWAVVWQQPVLSLRIRPPPSAGVREPSRSYELKEKFMKET